jgi:hypothetical protein
VFLQVLGGSGEATHLGRFTVEAQWHVNVLTGTGVGTFTLTGANGDTLVGTATGTSVILDGLAYITETCVITEGTGRFAGATGTFVTARVLTLTPPGTPAESTASFQGTISCAENVVRRRSLPHSSCGRQAGATLSYWPRR